MNFGRRDEDIHPVYRKFRTGARTWNWSSGHYVVEVSVQISLSPVTLARGWLWQVWDTRIGVVLYRLEDGRPRVSFYHPDQVEPVKRARGWPVPKELASDVKPVPELILVPEPVREREEMQEELPAPILINTSPKMPRAEQDHLWGVA